jgi:C4-type Zn-finger protein
MKIIERDKKICEDCHKNLEGKEDAFGIPVFKGFYFVREWICKDCMIRRAKEVLKNK